MKRIRRNEMGFRALFLLLTVTVSFYGTIASASPFNQECSDDLHCSSGFYCYTRSSSCIPCNQEICEKYLRHPGSTKCPRHKNDCGPCKDGRILLHGTCMVAEGENSALPSDPLEITNNATNLGIFSTSGSANFYFVLLTIVLFTGLIVGSLLAVYHKKRNNLSSNLDVELKEISSKEALLSPSCPEEAEIYQKPPPHNPTIIMETNRGHPGPRSSPMRFFEALLVDEVHARAIPFQDGNFASVSCDETLVTGFTNILENMTFTNPFETHGEPEDAHVVPILNNQAAVPGVAFLSEESGFLQNPDEPPLGFGDVGGDGGGEVQVPEPSAPPLDDSLLERIMGVLDDETLPDPAAQVNVDDGGADLQEESVLLEDPEPQEPQQ